MRYVHPQTLSARNSAVCKFAKKGLTPSQIGVILRDSYGVAQVKSVTGTKILRLLKKNGAFLLARHRAHCVDCAGLALRAFMLYLWRHTHCIRFFHPLPLHSSRSCAVAA